MEFTGFSADGLAFLTRLGSENRNWFQANKPRYEAEVANPAKAFVDAMTDLLQDRIGPFIEGKPKTNGSISPINNDLRFNPDAAPYKDHLLIKWWEGPNKKVAPVLYIRLSESEVGFATGMMLTDVDRWRDAVGGNDGAALVAAMAPLRKKFAVDVAGSALKKVPKPWPDDHPRGDLLRHKFFQLRWPEPTPPSVHSAKFAEFCADRLALAGDVHRWLVDHLG